MAIDRTLPEQVGATPVRQTCARVDCAFWNSAARLFLDSIHAMGDKGGKKDKEKHQNQQVKKLRQKEQIRLGKAKPSQPRPAGA